MLELTGESPGSEEKETFLAPGTFAWTPEPTPDLLPSPVEGQRGAGLPQPDTIQEDAVTRQVPHLIQGRLFVIIMATCIDDTIQWDVKDSQCAVQRNHNLNSKTGNLIETSAKGEISRPEVYENHNDTDGSGRQLGQRRRDTIKRW